MQYVSGLSQTSSSTELMWNKTRLVWNAGVITRRVYVADVVSVPYIHERAYKLFCECSCGLLNGLNHIIGSVKAKVEPLPTSLLTQIFPPCSSMNFREIARPSPVPSTFLEAVPTCRNSSNTIA